MNDYEQEMRQAMVQAMRGDLAGAIAAYERCRAARPNDLEPVLQLVDLLPRAGRAAEADPLADEMLARWPTDPAVPLAVARLREELGRPEEALSHLLGNRLDLYPEGNAYPDYLRLLVANGLFAEAAIEAQQGLVRETLWRPHALLAAAIAKAHLGDVAAVRAALDQLDVGDFGDLIDQWVDRLTRGNAIEPVRAALRRARDAAPDHARLAELARRFGA